MQEQSEPLAFGKPMWLLRNLPILASSHPADRGAGALLDHSPASEYVFSTRDTQSWLSSSWSFILLLHRWTWLDSTVCLLSHAFCIAILK
jgi:hypothetical protein